MNIDYEISSKTKTQSLENAIKKRYDFIDQIRKESESSSDNIETDLARVSLSSSLSESQILIQLPRRSRNRQLLHVTTMGINDSGVNCVKDESWLESMCGNLLELDLARNEFKEWDQVSFRFNIRSDYFIIK